MAGDAEASAVVSWRGDSIVTVLALARYCLVSEEEGPDNQHEVEEVEGRRRGERYKG